MIQTKNIIATVLASSAISLAHAQITTIPPTNIVPTDSLTIIVDLNLLDQTLDHVQNLIADADAGLDMFIWTWNPAEHPAGHPKVNGIGGAPWKNSNPALVMKKEGPRLYSWSIIPTEFYEVDAATVYQKDIHFLVKPQDGGGYGSPDRKSSDLVVKVDPPITERAVVYSFPASFLADDIMQINYDNARETKPSMQNLAPNNAFVYAECKLVDSTVIKIPQNYFVNMSNYPQTQMNYTSNGVFQLYMSPFEYFGLKEGDEIDEIKIIVRQDVWLGGAERVQDDTIFTVKCP